MTTKFYPLVWTKVRCLGEHHAVFLMETASGKRSLALPKHRRDSENSLERVQALQVLAPEFRCRCYEVLCAWRVYCSWTDGQIQAMLKSTLRDRPEAIPLLKAMREVSSKKTRANLQVSPSNVLALIPKELRMYAEEARQKRAYRVDKNKDEWRRTIYHTGNWEKALQKLPKGERTFIHSRNYRDSSVRSRKLAESFKSRYGFGFRENQGDFVDKWFRKRLAPAGLAGQEHRTGALRSKPFNFIQDVPHRPDGTKYVSAQYWMRHWWDHQWFRELCEFGFAPSSIPPQEMWIHRREGEKVFPSHPATVIGVTFKGTTYSCFTKYWIRIERVAGNWHFRVSTHPITTRY